MPEARFFPTCAADAIPRFPFNQAGPLGGPFRGVH